MKIIFIGDSLTFGYGLEKKYRWIEMLKSNTNLEVTNKGVNGDTTTGILSRFYEDIIIPKPDYAFIMAGTNDFLLGRSSFDVYDNIKMLIKDCAYNDIIPVIGIQPFVIGSMAMIYWSSYLDYSLVNSLIYTYKESIIDYCTKSSIRYIDFAASFRNIINLENKEEYFIDGIHPTKVGHELMYNMFLEIMEL